MGKQKAGENKAKARGPRQLRGKGNGKDRDAEVSISQHRARGTGHGARGNRACCDTGELELETNMPYAGVRMEVFMR